MDVNGFRRRFTWRLYGFVKGNQLLWGVSSPESTAFEVQHLGGDARVLRTGEHHRERLHLCGGLVGPRRSSLSVDLDRGPKTTENQGFSMFFAYKTTCSRRFWP